MRILVFGDSVGQGFFDAKGGWAARLSAEAQNAALKDLNGDWPEVFNVSVDGDTADDVRKRIEAETKSRLKQSNSHAILILAVGLNDACLRDNRVEVDEQDFQRQYKEAIDKVRPLFKEIYCLGLNAVNESMTDPWPYSTTGKSWRNNRINLFEDCIKQLCILEGLKLIPLHDGFAKALAGGQQLLADGLHPNEAGHEFIYERVKAEIGKFLS